MINELTIQKKQHYTVRATSCLKRMAQDIIELSQIAHEYYQEFGYQDYISWVKEELKLSDKQGERFLNVYNKFGITDNLSVENIGASALYLLSAPSTPESAREEALELAEAGETVTHAKAKELVEAHKEIERLKAENEYLKSTPDEPITFPLLPEIENLLKTGRIMPAKAKMIQDMTPSNQRIWLSEFMGKFSAENQLEEKSAKIKKLEAKNQAEPQVIEKVIEVIPDDYDNLRKQVSELQKAVEIKKQQLENEIKSKKEITELKNSVEKSLVGKLDKANEELSKLDNKRREIKALQDLDDASKLISRAYALFTNDRGVTITSITTTILRTVEGIRNKLELFENQDDEIIDII